jgi:hypothetical protein
MASYISNSPFFVPWFTRDSATAHVQTTRGPVLRTSSIRGFYALTYVDREYGIIHTLLRQNPDATVDVMNSDTKTVYSRFRTVHDLLRAVLAAPAAAPVSTDGDPC